jgi:hypothetical protein
MESHHDIDATLMHSSQVVAAAITACIQGQQNTQHGHRVARRLAILESRGMWGWSVHDRLADHPYAFACERSQGVVQTCRHASRYSSNEMPIGALEGSRLQRESSGRITSPTSTAG